jgi:hypothetical protein
MGTIATLRSDTNPEGEPQQGLPFNNMWDMHIPRHKPDEQCKAVAYTQKALHHSYAIRNNLIHPLSNPNSVVINVLEGDEILIHLINTYNPPNPKPPNSNNTPPDFCRTTLKYLTDHDIDE